MRYGTWLIAAVAMLDGGMAHAQAWSTINGGPVRRPKEEWQTISSLPPTAPVHSELRRTRRMIDGARRAGQLTRDEAREFRRESRRIDAMVGRSGGSETDRQHAQAAARALESRINAKRGTAPR
ncbi:hypothetical protein [Sphingomonas sp. CLY1604]|uniref:hypothetical protein n=1 Tax=Sphingomonas sp. CLY1604 TaxID=3457786 RepID=UPI003FD7143B